MKKDSRLSAVLHALLHMSEHGGPMTSDTLARCMHTHAVVVRRTMAGLRDAGFVVSERGHGGGWVLARALDSVTLLDVQLALGEASAPGERPPPECLVEQAVQRALGQSLDEAEALLTRRLSEVTLADLAADFHRGMQARGLHAGDLAQHHPALAQHKPQETPHAP